MKLNHTNKTKNALNDDSTMTSRQEHDHDRVTRSHSLDALRARKAKAHTSTTNMNSSSSVSDAKNTLIHYERPSFLRLLLISMVWICVAPLVMIELGALVFDLVLALQGDTIPSLWN